MTQKPKPMTQNDKKAISGLLMIVFLIVLPIFAAVVGNWQCGLGIFVAFWAGALATRLPEWKG